VIVACTGVQKALLREEFPSLTFIELRGYEIRYDKNRAFTILRLMRSIPKILIRIKQEKAWLEHFAAREGLDLVISDNRYGLNIPGIPCIFITHQLLIKTPFGSWADRLLQSLHYRIIRRFSRCWIPDVAIGGLAGDLSHPERMPSIPTRYIGWLSRFGSPVAASSAPGENGPAIEQASISSASIAAPGENSPAIEQTSIGSAPIAAPGADLPAPFLLALLSGPEPQRTLLEKDLLRQAQALGNKPPTCRLVIVRGLPGGSGPPLAPTSSVEPAGHASEPAGAAPEPAGHASEPGGAAPEPAGHASEPARPVSEPARHASDQAAWEPSAAALPSWVTLHNHLPAKALEPLLLAAGLVLARPGYSTVMDLERLGKRALFIPTPGQTEQEYLGPYLAAKGGAACVDQRALSLAKALEMAAATRGMRERQAEDPGLLAAEIKAVLTSLEDPGV
jgi:hypothetical protein